MLRGVNHRRGGSVYQLKPGTDSIILPPFSPPRLFFVPKLAKSSKSSPFGGCAVRPLQATLPSCNRMTQTTAEETLIAQQRPMRWYNPSLGDFEWREVPMSDEEALSLLDGYHDAHLHAEVYREWRDLGASIMSALMRAGEAAKKERDQGVST